MKRLYCIIVEKQGYVSFSPFLIHSAGQVIMALRTTEKFIRLVLVLFCLLAYPAMGWALAPEEVAVIANGSATGSLELAEYYMAKRRIPKDNLIRIATTSNERCSRETYDTEIRRPIRQALARMGTASQIRCLVVMYGTPLAILPPDLSKNDQLILLKKQLQALEEEGKVAGEERRAAIPAEKKQLEQQIVRIEKAEPQAAVDSELALVLAGEYPLAGWLPNPYFVGYGNQKTMFSRNEVLMVSRLDGPDPATVRRLVDDALYTEKKGLRGRAYFDARWPRPEGKELSGYALYDAALHKAAEGVRQSGRMKEVRLDARSELFQPGDCPQAALYCGWYSLGHYVDAFSWARGAIGYHIASAECTTLKKPESQVWCKRMLEEGVAATLGPVNEPYVQAFPLPDVFFSTLAEGYLGLAESYLISLPFLSWQMVLIGDPLYQPFSPQ